MIQSFSIFNGNNFPESYLSKVFTLSSNLSYVAAPGTARHCYVETVTLRLARSQQNIVTERRCVQGWLKLAQFGLVEFWGVANFGFNYLKHFSINFENSCAHLVANFLKFLKLPKHFKFACFSRMLWTKTQKIRNQKICQFEPTLKSNLFGD